MLTLCCCLWMRLIARVTCRKNRKQEQLGDIQKKKNKVRWNYDSATRYCCKSYLGIMRFGLLLFMCLDLNAELESTL